MNRYPSENWKAPYRPMALNVCPEAGTRCKSRSGHVYYRPAGPLFQRILMPVRRLTAKLIGKHPTPRRLARYHSRRDFILREFPELRQAKA